MSFQLIPMINVNQLKSDKIDKFKFLFAIVFIFSLILRSIYAFIQFSPATIKALGDDIYYSVYANQVLNGNLFWLMPHSPEMVVAPGIPYYLAMCNLLFGDSWLFVFLVNSFISSITVLLIGITSYELFKNRAIAIITGAWSSIYVLFLRQITTGGKEIWLGLLVLVICFLLVKQYQKKNDELWGIILLSIAFILMSHIDDRYLAFNFPIFIGFYLLRSKNCMHWIKKVLLFSLFSLMLSFPWIIRNYLYYDRIIIISPRTNHLTEKIFGYEHKALIDWDLAKKNVQEQKYYLSDSQLDSIKHNLSIKGKQIDELEKQAILNGLTPRVLSIQEQYWSRFVELWRPFAIHPYYWYNGYRFAQWSFLHNISVFFSYGVLLPFFCIGLVILLIHRPRIGLSFITFIATHSLVHIFFIPFSRYRYRVPIDSLIIIISIWGLFSIIKYFYLKKMGSTLGNA